MVEKPSVLNKLAITEYVFKILLKSLLGFHADRHINSRRDSHETPQLHFNKAFNVWHLKTFAAVPVTMEAKYDTLCLLEASHLISR